MEPNPMTIWSQKYFLKKNKLKKIGNYFFEKKSGHQYRFKISLRIEWEHSQPLKITLKHSNLHPINPYQENHGLGP